MTIKLLIITSVGPGIGQTTLATSLAADLADVDSLNEESVFTRPEFREVGDHFRRKAHPSAELLEEAYARVVQTLQASGALGLMDWSFVDLAENLDWAMANVDALYEHSRRVREITRPLDPRVLYLDGDIGEGLRRREEQYGRRWLERHASRMKIPEGDWPMRLEAMVRRYIPRRQRILDAFAAADWPVTIVDGNRTPDDVLASAREALVEWF